MEYQLNTSPAARDAIARLKQSFSKSNRAVRHPYAARQARAAWSKPKEFTRCQGRAGRPLTRKSR